MRSTRGDRDWQAGRRLRSRSGARSCRQGYRGGEVRRDQALRRDGWVRRPLPVARLLHGRGEEPAEGHRHPHSWLRQVPLQQARPGRHRWHTARAGRGAVQRLLLPRSYRHEAEGGLRAERHQRASHLLRHRLVRAEGRGRAAGTALPRGQGDPPRADTAGLPLSGGC